MVYDGLVLFDIDGTLVRRAGPQHGAAMIEAVRRVTGISTSLDGIPLYGMLDPDIITGMMSNAGASRAEIRAAMPEIIRRAQSIYLRNCPAADRITRKVCPGVRRLLHSLRRKRMLLGLVTGNLTRIGWRKIERCGLREYFSFGAFGEMGPTRGHLAKLAVARARREGWIARKAPAALIGDAPADILAAKFARLRSVAVGTGIVPLPELRRYDPDLVVEDLRSLTPGMLL